MKMHIQILNLMVENDEPHWSLNVKKAISSLIQLDVTGVRSFAAESAVFGERSGSLLETYEVRRTLSLSKFCVLHDC